MARVKSILTEAKQIERAVTLSAGEAIAVEVGDEAILGGKPSIRIG